MAYRSSSDASKSPEQGDRAYNALMHEVQQKFMWHKERTSSRLQKIEDMIELATHKMSLIERMSPKNQDKEVVNSCGWKYEGKQNEIMSSGMVKQEILHHLKPIFPNFEEGSGVCEVFGIGNKTEEWPIEGNVDRKEEPEDYQEYPRYDEVPGEDKEDWHCEELILAVLGMESPSQHKQNSDEDNSTGAKGLDYLTDVKRPFASFPTAVLSYVPKKIYAEKIGEFELRRTSIEMISASKEGLDQPKELKPELQVLENLPIQLDRPRLQCHPCLILVSQGLVSIKVSGKVVGSTQQQLSVGILVNYRIITIFDPGGYLICLYEAQLVGDFAGN